MPALHVVALKYSIRAPTPSARYTTPLVTSTASAVGLDSSGSVTVVTYAFVDALYTATVPLLFAT